MNTDTTAYWKKSLQEILAMVKQLGRPKFFITLSCPDLCWNELLLIITELRREVFPEDSINKIGFFERFRYRNFNLVVPAGHFSV